MRKLHCSSDRRLSEVMIIALQSCYSIERLRPPPTSCIRYIPTARRLRNSYILPRYLNHDATHPSRRRLERSIPLPDIPQVKLATITQYGPQPRSYNLGTPYGTYSRRNRRDIRPVPTDTLTCTQHVTPAEHPLDTPRIRTFHTYSTYSRSSWYFQLSFV